MKNNQESENVAHFSPSDLIFTEHAVTMPHPEHATILSTESPRATIIPCSSGYHTMIPGSDNTFKPRFTAYEFLQAAEQVSEFSELQFYCL